MDYIIGLLFSFFWASGSLATKIGVKSADPLTLALMRFGIAGSLLFLYNYVFTKGKRFPKAEEWKKLAIFGLFGTTIYSGCYFIATETTSVGLLNLFVAINPLIIILISTFWLKKPITKNEVIGFIICTFGLATATFPSLKNSTATPFGIFILSIGMISYSFANVYYGKMNLDLSNITINTWQVILGGFLLIPFAIFAPNKHISFDNNLVFSVFWLSIIISICTTLLWYYLLKKDTVKASKWLYLSPILGYLLSYFLLNESITLYAMIGTAFVIFGLYISKKKNIEAN